MAYILLITCIISARLYSKLCGTTDCEADNTDSFKDLGLNNGEDVVARTSQLRVHPWAFDDHGDNDDQHRQNSWFHICGQRFRAYQLSENGSPRLEAFANFAMSR